MDKLLYVAMTGAKQTRLAQAISTHNLANANTTGFHADLQNSRSVAVSGPGHQSRVYSVTEGAGVDMSNGPILATGRELDVAVNGEGWIAIQSPDGSEAYTRAGDLRVNSSGLLTTGAGYSVMGNGSPIAVPPFEKLEIASDGTISIRPLGQGASTLAIVDRIKLVNPPASELKKSDDGLIRHTGEKPPAVDASVRLQSGALESSNVNTVEAMVKMIELARQFETQIKVMQTAEENDRASAQLMRMS